MAQDYDVAVIGMGPAGMAVSAMAAEMGLRVCAVERHRVGGECMNVGCIPSKALLQAAKYNFTPSKFASVGIAPVPAATVLDPFAKIRAHLDFIAKKKLAKMLDKIEIIKAEAAFNSPRSLLAGDREIRASKIFICCGTRPAVPAFPGLAECGYLTNNNMFDLDKVPATMLVIGGGAIACEMAQAFSRLGCEVSIIIRGESLIRHEGPAMAATLERGLEGEGVRILRGQSPLSFRREGGLTVMKSDKGEELRVERVLVATGREYDFSALCLDKAGVKYGPDGIRVDKYLRTSNKHVMACGDCNGFAQLSHAAMHQGMVALMNCLMPFPFKRDFRKFAVPWTIFTDPQVSHVGMRESELKKRGMRYEVVETAYGDYGAAIAEGLEAGFVKAYVSPSGLVLGVDIVGENSGEMINEWALVVQERIRIHKILMLQHSFPTMGFMSKRLGEIWMMGKMRSPALKRLCQLLFRTSFKVF